MGETTILRKSQRQPFPCCHNTAPTAAGKEPLWPSWHLGHVCCCGDSLFKGMCRAGRCECRPAGLLCSSESAQGTADVLLLLFTDSHCSAGVLSSAQLSPLAWCPQQRHQDLPTSTTDTSLNNLPSPSPTAAGYSTAHPHCVQRIF